MSRVSSLSTLASNHFSYGALTGRPSVVDKTTQTYKRIEVAIDLKTTASEPSYQVSGKVRVNFSGQNIKEVPYMAYVFQGKPLPAEQKKNQGPRIIFCLKNDGTLPEELTGSERAQYRFNSIATAEPINDISSKIENQYMHIPKAGGVFVLSSSDPHYEELTVAQTQLTNDAIKIYKDIFYTPKRIEELEPLPQGRFQRWRNRLMDWLINGSDQ